MKEPIGQKAAEKEAEELMRTEFAAQGEELWMPDGSGGLEKRHVATAADYHRAWFDEGMRVLQETFPTKAAEKPVEGLDWLWKMRE